MGSTENLTGHTHFLNPLYNFALILINLLKHDTPF
jgi:hypothetical protein